VAGDVKYVAAGYIAAGWRVLSHQSLSRYDEDDVRIRPGRRSRPRSRIRPAHRDAVPGVVVAVDRGRYSCVLDTGAASSPVVAMLARELGRAGLVVGDRVFLIGDVSGGPDSLARIVRVADRRSTLRRTADDTDPVERVVVANVDQLVIVTALADPAPQPRFIDRCLVAAYDSGITPLLCLTKADLAAPDTVLDAYGQLGVPAVTTRRGEDSGVLRGHLTGRWSAFIGSSGVGKSTLVNTLVPSADRAVGAVNLVTGRGRHTSSSAVALPLVDGTGWIVDTPGIRSFGLAHVRRDTVVASFPDLAAGLARCPRGCPHDNSDCGLDSWVADGNAEEARLISLRRLLANIGGGGES
jgi:ribosome biogenesis GTPase / thiamine phosphate phosphatase